MFDTWGKIDSVYFLGNNFNFGSYSDCLNFRHDMQNSSKEGIHGQYCLLQVFPMPTIVALRRLTKMMSGAGPNEFDLSDL